MRPIKKHGLVCPLHPLQLLSWLVILYTIGVCYAVVLPMLSLHSQVIFGVLFSACEIAGFIFGLWATIIDPTDLMVYKKKAEDENADYRAFCSLCNCNVQLSSKHCGQCNRCVDQFDHHCKWLNNCVGGRNYHAFALLIATLQVTTVVVIAFAAVVVEDRENVERNLEDGYGEGHYTTILGLTCSVLFLNICVFFANGQLILLHIWLKLQGLTTYEYIMQKRSQRRPSSTDIQPENPEVSEHLESDRANLVLEEDQEKQENMCRAQMETVTSATRNAGHAHTHTPSDGGVNTIESGL